MNWFNNFKIATKINSLVVAILIIFSVILAIVLQALVTSGVKEISVDKAISDLGLSYIALDTKYPGDWEVRGEQLYKGTTLVNGNDEMVDYIGELTNGAVTIFLEDTRVSTNVIVEGNRAIGTQVSNEVKEVVLEGGQVFQGEANVAGIPHQTAYQPIMDSNGETIGMWFVGVSEQFINEMINNTIRGFFITLAIGILIATVIIFVFTNQIKKRLNNIRNALVEAGNGNFTTDIKEHSKDEIGQLSNSYNLMKDSLKLLIEKVVDTAGQVSASSQQLSAGADETSKATEQITEAIQMVATGAEDQVYKTNSANDSANEISISMKKIMENVKEVTESAQLTKGKSDIGHEVIQHSVGQMDIINERTEKVTSIINQLGDKTNEINNIVAFITGVSEQTNLLALNAAIEAARAGEHGRGFAVVADEVKKLAEQSNDFAEQIKKLIDGILVEINQTISNMDETRGAVQDGIIKVRRAGNEFEGISYSVTDVTNRVDEISSAVSQMANKVDLMVTFINDVSIKAEESSSYSEEVAASAEEQNATMEEIAGAASLLTSMAENLQESVSRFKL
ncbi:methyl-accepting chemotaxis protein [Alkalihalobacillus alcalophilus ATCC 27647 = CGMCC 1.3604]|uniref:Chemotaxis protein n=1 Tax=Alkalihalobacillus alcalophilus ATCC 27647 = CGMCC 1.3604 TaxID=1218173 RepID=A0A094YQM0_ALKAL|nr:methyl-accepting chemotaxis protein [Alkalihalobacillus alcalophilus]KGA95727.1 chemotaxis protein [Alkalihalobacillus alcalophilus ATCC 27647 = CGMCC 1.3604]MED1564170.1 methyl-accepting chemotaxis protein [Alkalihalobacillus alcalophilus]THG88676.1 methyl-accepting chemotaxis protein [Alkalihalobacillus alcalophilus ATCC 27647 = CGMCC 1.3604]